MFWTLYYIVQQGIASALVVECHALSYRAVNERGVALLLYWSPVLWPLYFVARLAFVQAAISQCATRALRLRIVSSLMLLHRYFEYVNRYTEARAETETRVRVARLQKFDNFFVVLYRVLSSKLFWSSTLLTWYLTLATQTEACYRCTRRISRDVRFVLERRQRRPLLLP